MRELAPTPPSQQLSLAPITGKNVWNLKLIASLIPGGLGPAWSPDGRWLAAMDANDILLYDTHNFPNVSFILHTNFYPDTIIFNHDGTQIMYFNSNVNDTSIEIWDIATKSGVLSVQGEYRPKFSHDGRFLVANDATDLNMSVWDIKAKKRIFTLKESRDPIFSPDGSLMVSSGTLSNTGTIQIWKTDTYDLLLSLKGHNTGVDNMKFSQNGAMLVSASEDGTVNVWDIKTRQIIASLSFDCTVYVAFAPDPTYVLIWSQSCGKEKNVKLWKITKPEYRVAAMSKYSVHNITFNNDGSLFLLEDNDANTQFVNPETGEVPLTLQNAIQPQLNSDGTLLATTSLNNGIQIWGISQ